MAYVTALEIRTQIQSDNSADDAFLQIIADACEDLINRFTNRKDGFVGDALATPRVFTTRGNTYTWIDENIAITQVGMKLSTTDTTYTPLVAADWIAFSGDPNFPNFNDLPYTGLMMAAGQTYSNFYGGTFGGLAGFRPDTESVRNVPMLQVTAKWGYAVTVPPIIKQACLIQAASIYKEAQSSFGAQLASAEFGTLQYARELHPKTVDMLKKGRFMRPAIG